MHQPSIIGRRAFVLGLGVSALTAGGASLAGCRSSAAPGSAAPGSAAPGSAATDGSAPPGHPSTASGGHNGAVRTDRVPYGDDPSQFAELYRPATAQHAGVVVLVHGGFWRAEYGLSLGRPLATDLAGRGFTCWNIEYRRVGDGGGWPATFDDVAAAIDKLADLPAGLAVDTSAVVAVGHSAGGQLAAWAAGRGTLPGGAPGADPAVHLVGAVSQAGVLDLRTAARTGVGGTAAQDLLGGGPSAVAERYRLADPIERVPLRVPVLCVHARADANVPFAQSTAYVAAATAAGGAAALHKVPGNHFTLIDPASEAWAVVRDALPDLLRGQLPG